jgi:hypothetical protein
LDIRSMALLAAGKWIRYCIGSHTNVQLNH